MLPLSWFMATARIAPLSAVSMMMPMIIMGVISRLTTIIFAVASTTAATAIATG
jgi:hypothetical protein